MAQFLPLLGGALSAMCGGSGGGSHPATASNPVASVNVNVHQNAPIRLESRVDASGSASNQNRSQAVAENSASSSSRSTAASAAVAESPATQTTSPPVAPAVPQSLTEGLSPAFTAINEMLVFVMRGLAPIGGIIDFAGSTVPLGYLECDGRAISRAEYPDLFLIIGTLYGATNSTDFRVPDCRGHVVAGQSASGEGPLAGVMNTAVMGGKAGVARHSLTIDEMPSHNHGGASGNENSAGSNPRIYCDVGASAGKTDHRFNQVGPEGNRFCRVVDFDGPNPQCLHVHAINAQGGGQPHLNVQPTILLKKIIRVK